MLLPLKRNEDAVKTFTNLTEQAPDNAAAWMRMGLALAKLGKCNESLAAYDKAISLDGNNTEAWIDRGDAQLCLGQVNQAQETYERVLKKDSHSGPALERMASISYQNGKYRAAQTYAEKSIGSDRIHPANYSRTWFTYANALNASHEHDRAIAQYLIAEEKTLSTSPLDPQVDLREIEWALGSVYLHRADHERYNQNRSDYSQAAAYFENLTKKNESDAGAWIMQGICNLKLWQFDKAKTCFDQVLKDDPANQTAAEWMARVGDERQPHIIVAGFSNEGIILPSWRDISLNWRPPEIFHARLENLADVDGNAEASIWTVANEHVRRVRLETFPVLVQKNSHRELDEEVKLPFDAFVDWPTNIPDILDFINSINQVELTCEVTVKETS
jgi:tetratricopeptide (TPR) repeat protein